MSGRRARGVVLLVLAGASVGGSARARPRAAPGDIRAAFVGRGPTYVGQPVDVRVIAITDGERPVVTPPPVEGATMAPAGTATRPISATGIGATVSQAVEYRFRFRLVPGRAGTLRVPGFRVEADGRSESTPELRREVRPVPAAGRPVSWLGGVGPLEVAAEARPAAVRVGEPFELVVTLTGPGALGSVGALERARIEDLPISPQVDPAPDDLTMEPPRRIRRLRIRPTRPGRVAIPPVMVAWFDPASGRYQVAAGPAVPVRVEGIVAFDPGRVSYNLPAARSRRRRLWGLPVLAALPYLAWRTRRARRRRREDERRQPGSYLVLIAQAERETAEARGMAQRLAFALRAFLGAVESRECGELTPAEARDGFERVCRDPEIGERAADLVWRCDVARFSGQAGESSAELARLGRELFEALGRAELRSPRLEGGGGRDQD